MIVSPPTVSEITCGLFTRYLTVSPSVLARSQPSPKHINQEFALGQEFVRTLPATSQGTHSSSDAPICSNLRDRPSHHRGSHPGLGGGRLALAGPLHRPLHKVGAAQAR